MSAVALLLASTKRIEAPGAIACAHWTSRQVSVDQEGLNTGSVEPPVWLTFWKDGGAGIPNVALKVARSAAMFGLS